MTDRRDRFLARVTRDQTFADVGGLWGTTSERVSVAHDCGASSLTMIDITPKGGHLWAAFDERMKEKKINDYACVSSDICKVKDLNFDVVHCSGVLYHHPKPQVLLAALRRVTRKHLVLTSAVTQEVVKNRLGTYRIPPSGVLFVPALKEAERLILAEYWRGIGVEAHGITEVVTYEAEQFGPWWWLPTAHAMTAMASAAGFKLLDQGPTWAGNAHTLLLEPV